MLLLCCPGAVFLLRIDVGIIVEDRDPEIIRQIFQHIAAARGTAGVQQECGRLLLRGEACNQLFQFSLIISPVHIPFSFADRFL